MKKSKKPIEKKSETKNKLIAIIRISGMVKINKDVENALHRLRLRRKYSCILVKPTKNIMGMISKIRYHIAYGEISEGTLVKLLKERGQKIDKNKKMHAKEITASLFSGKKLSELELKPFFRLHPPRKGIKSKLQYPKGVLGNNKEDINKLIETML